MSFALGDLHPHDVGQVLDERGIAVRVGHHCARPVCLRYGVPATTRASFYLYSTTAEVDALVDGPRARAAVLRPEVLVKLESMYQEIILDHYRRPHHKGLREPFDAEVHHVNPTCGDEVTLRVKVDDGVVDRRVLRLDGLLDLAGLGVGDDRPRGRQGPRRGDRAPTTRSSP